jgi:ferredoxin-NADP reductase
LGRRQFNLVLDSVHDIAPGVKHFAFRREDGEPLEFLPGQFVQLFFDCGDGEKFRRSYSIASVPGRDATIDIAVSAVVDGRATERFWALKPGDMVEAMGPFGRLVLRDEPPARHVLVATGTGVTPYRAMLPDLANRLETGWPEVHLLMGVRTREDLLYGDEFVAFAQAHPGFRFTAHYSREPDDALQSWERRGYVQHAFPELGLDPNSDVVYLCGNPDMIDQSMAWLTERGFPAPRVRREKYISGA